MCMYVYIRGRSDKYIAYKRKSKISLVSGVYQLDPCFVDGHETTQKFLRIALKQRQTLLWNGLTVAIVVRSEQTQHSSRRKLSHAQYFMQDMTHAVFWCLMSQLSRTPWIGSLPRRDHGFFTLSSVVVDFGAPGRGSSKINVQPLWNSLNQFLTVATEGEESPYTASKCSSISLRDFPSKNKNRITDWTRK